MDNSINKIGEKLIFDHDLVLRVRMSAFNHILTVLVNNRSDDTRLIFNGNRPWIEERKIIFGIPYTNYLNIDGGEVVLNIEDFHFQSFSENILTASLRIAGHGNIQVSGKYLGILASSSPDIEISMNESIQFSIATGDTGEIILKPIPKPVLLNIKILVKLLEWKIPWSERQTFALEDVIKPIRIPAAIKSSLNFPVPSDDPREKFRSTLQKISVMNASLGASYDVLDWRSDIEFVKK